MVSTALQIIVVNININIYINPRTTTKTRHPPSPSRYTRQPFSDLPYQTLGTMHFSKLCSILLCAAGAIGAALPAKSRLQRAPVNESDDNLQARDIAGIDDVFNCLALLAVEYLVEENFHGDRVDMLVELVTFGFITADSQEWYQETFPDGIKQTKGEGLTHNEKEALKKAHTTEAEEDFTAIKPEVKKEMIDYDAGSDAGSDSDGDKMDVDSNHDSDVEMTGMRRS
ncbi:Uu.00g031360.m01.CDS01 [Anthostomella pinea]|uniref:Uu.00g031360.m01.CDS01 n=1 Tax=Anthostomella pinea TaxID=933095 RepID=A0AAI8YD74_9PEZI|nr:Uu.00g031360.m01.CDS01 [Anthostomella pinea]